MVSSPTNVLSVHVALLTAAKEICSDLGVEREAVSVEDAAIETLSGFPTESAAVVELEAEIDV